jgi:hypothetical protein
LLSGHADFRHQDVARIPNLLGCGQIFHPILSCGNRVVRLKAKQGSQVR